MEPSIRWFLKKIRKDDENRDTQQQDDSCYGTLSDSYALTYIHE